MPRGVACGWRCCSRLSAAGQTPLASLLRLVVLPGPDAPDGEPAHLIVLVLTPQEDPAAQLEISADVARRFRDPAAIQRILRTNTFTEFLAQAKMLEG